MLRLATDGQTAGGLAQRPVSHTPTIPRCIDPGSMAHSNLKPPPSLAVFIHPPLSPSSALAAIERHRAHAALSVPMLLVASRQQPDKRDAYGWLAANDATQTASRQRQSTTMAGGGRVGWQSSHSIIHTIAHALTLRFCRCRAIAATPRRLLASTATRVCSWSLVHPTPPCICVQMFARWFQGTTDYQPVRSVGSGGGVSSSDSSPDEHTSLTIGRQQAAMQPAAAPQPSAVDSVKASSKAAMNKVKGMLGTKCDISRQLDRQQLARPIRRRLSTRLQDDCSSVLA